MKRIKSVFFRVCIACIAFILLLISYLFIFEIPSYESIKNPLIKEASKIVDAKRRMIGLYEAENRILISKEDINPHIKKALIAAEDERFYEHSGVDVKALLRVFLKTILMQEKESGGGSTITQQLAKQLYKRPDFRNRNFIIKKFLLVKSKIKEWIIALKIEKVYDKDEIMTMYLNKFEFINDAHGIESAAKTYFGKKQNQLSLLESATLVGMLKNPSLYNPVRFLKKTMNRRNDVIAKIEAKFKLNLDTLKSQPLDISKYERRKYIEGPMPYFRNELAKWLTKTIEVHKLVKSDGSFYDIYGDALTIETTIDLDLQKYAEEASNEHMQWLQNWFFRMWRGKDPWTFNADAAQKEMRKQTLHSQAKESIRYQYLKDAILSPHLVKHSYGVSLTDDAIEYLTTGNITILNHIAKKQKEKYINFRNSEKFNTLKPVLIQLNASFEKEFNTKVKMKIYDLKLGEKEVEMTPMDSVKYHAMHMQNAMILIDPRDGQVKSWVGGLDYKYFKYDHVTSRRSIGSTMKPFLYTVAMQEKGIKPCTQYKDVEYSIAPFEAGFKNKERWAPHNATEVYTTLMYNLYHGLLYSKNSITVKILKEVGSIDPLRNLLDKVGISKTEKLQNGRLAVPELPSAALGAIDINLLQLTGAYSTFANNGVFREPIFVKSIKDKNGKIIYQAKQKETKAIQPLYNAIMVDMLKNVVGGEFTMGLKSENAGKTGTTDDQSDGWFMGFTPSLVGGVWTGGDDKWIRFTNVDIGQGYFTARPAFERLMKKLESDKTGLYDASLRFSKPPNGFKELTNCSKVKTEPLPEFLRPKNPTVDSTMLVGKEVKIDSMKIDILKKK